MQAIKRLVLCTGGDARDFERYERGKEETKSVRYVTKKKKDGMFACMRWVMVCITIQGTDCNIHSRDKERKESCCLTTQILAMPQTPPTVTTRLSLHPMGRDETRAKEHNGMPLCHFCEQLSRGCGESSTLLRESGTAYPHSCIHGENRH